MLRVVQLFVLSVLVAQPALASVIWRGDFSTGNTSQWTSREVAATDRVQVVTSPVPPGQQYAMQATVKSGDSVYGGARAELDYETDRPSEGSERYYRWQTYFPADFNSANYWQLFTQWHQYIDGGSPPLAFMAWGEKIQLGNDQDVYFWNAPLVRGVWHEFVFHVTWSSDSAKGRIELWYDGQKVLAPTAARTLFPNDTVYMKQGLYRKSLINYTQVVYTAGTVIGTTLADVASNAPVAATVTPNPVAFSPVQLGATATKLDVAVRNPGTTPLSVNGYALTGSTSSAFSISPASAATTIAAGQSATWTVTYNPSAVGASAGVLTFTTGTGALATNLSGTCVSLSGTGSVGLSSTSVSFGSVDVGATSSKSVRVSNSGTAPLLVQSVGIGGADALEFSLSEPLTAAVTVAAGQSITIPMVYAPTAAHNSAATLSVVTDDPARPVVSATLSGQGLSANLMASAMTLEFGTSRVGAAAEAQTLTLTNSGNADTVISSLVLTGDADFSVTSSQGSSFTLRAGRTATLTLGFTPTTHGDRSATLTVGPITVALTGTGIQPGLDASPTTLSFGTLVVGMPAVTQTLSISNGGTAALRLATPTVEAVNGSVYAVSAPPAEIAVGETGTLTVTFTPSAAGAFNGVLHLGSIDSDALTADIVLSAMVVAPEVSEPTPVAARVGCSSVDATSLAALCSLLALTVRMRRRSRLV